MCLYVAGAGARQISSTPASLLRCYIVRTHATNICLLCTGHRSVDRLIPARGRTVDEFSFVSNIADRLSDRTIDACRRSIPVVQELFKC